MKLILKAYQWILRCKVYLLSLLFILLYILLHPVLVDKLIGVRLAPFLVITPGILADIVFGLLFITGILLIIGKLKSIPKIRWETLILPLVLLLVYLLHRLGVVHTKFGLAAFKWVSFLRYADAAVLLGIYALIKGSNHVTVSTVLAPSSVELLEDNIYDKQSDLLRRKPYASRIAKMINAKKTTRAFAIGVKGDWGSGKSVFLQQVRSHFNGDICMSFNPWIGQNAAEVVGAFFTSIVKAIEPYDNTLSRTIDQYYNTLVRLDKEWNKGFMSSIGLLRERKAPESLEQLKKKIDSQLKGLDVKIIIFIDDIDRASAEEIISVFRIIRNSFDFPNVFFLVAYDELYIRQTLKDHIETPERYLEKIFQFEIDLPGFPFMLLKNTLLKLLLDNANANIKGEMYPMSIRAAVDYTQRAGILQDVIVNMRSVIRLANSFNHTYFIKYSEINTLDFLLLELLKMKNRKEFEEVRRSFVSEDRATFLSFPNDSLAESVVKFESNGEELDSGLIIAVLFSRKVQEKDLSMLRYPQNALRYFSDDLFGQISYSDFASYNNEGFGDFRSLIVQEMNNYRLSELGYDLSTNADNLKNGLTLAEDNTTELFNMMLRAPINSSHAFFNINKGLMLVENTKLGYVTSEIVYANLERYFDQLNTWLNAKELDEYLEMLLTYREQVPKSECAVLGRILTTTLSPGSISPLRLMNRTKVMKWLIINMQNISIAHSDTFTPDIFIAYRNAIDYYGVEGKIVYDAGATTVLLNYIWDVIERLYIIQSTIDNPRIISDPVWDSAHNEMVASISAHEMKKYVRKRYPNSRWIQAYLSFYEGLCRDYDNPNAEHLIMDFVSDEDTMFRNHWQSDAKAVEITDITKRVVSNEMPELANAKWIAHTESITVDEAKLGGSYFFCKRIELPFDRKIKEATIALLVDDALHIDIKEKFYPSNGLFTGFDGRKEPHKAKLLLQPGYNDVYFTVINAPMLAKDIEESRGLTYGFIYRIRVVFERQ